MEFSHTGDETTGYYQNSHTPDIENKAKSHYQKLNVQVISVEDNQYDQLSDGTFKDTKPYDGYLQLPEFNRENTESNYDYLKLYGSVKTNQCPDIGSIELSDFPSGHNVDIENRPCDSSKQDIVALDSIHLNEDDIYHEINDTARPNLNKTHQGSKNNLDVSQTLHTNKDTTNTERSHKYVSKGTSLTWKHKCMLFVMVVVITVSIAVGTLIYILVNKESEKEVPTHLSCTHVSNARLYFGPIEMLCTIPTSEKFEYVGFHYGTGLDNSLYGVVLNKNGTILQIHKTNSDIYVRLIEITSQYMIIITFSNVTCAMDGVYRLALMRQEVGALEEYKGTNGYLQVKRPTGKPTFTLNADQVIDIVFPDGHYYRGSSIHKCEGLVGQSLSKLEIDITNDDGISFQQIPDEIIELFRTNISDKCSIKQTVSFGLKFSSEMDGARLRCRVSDSIDDFTLSEELSLIPRNMCNCGASESYRGHPGNCNVQVYCVEENGTMYPRGIACTSNQCRNSITGYCTNDCSDPVCNEAVPSDFCTTLAPSSTAPTLPPYFSTSSISLTTSSAASYIVCTDIVALGNSETAVIRCYLNDTATFTVFNVTYKRLGKSDVQHIALIDENNNIHMFAMEEIVDISMLNYIIYIKILNSSCENEGTFAVVTNINGESVMDQGKFSIISKPNGDADLQLHPDQIAGLLNYRNWLLHTCIINVGYPPGEISIEMMKQDESKFTKLNVIIHSTNDDTDNVTCSITRTVAFGFLFTADMDKATIRCSVTNDFDTEDSFVFSNNDTVSLIPIDFCKNETDSRSYHPHPTNCHWAVQCDLGVTYGIPCPSGLCFGVTETNGCNYCYLTTCLADVSTTPVPGSSTSAFAIDVFCNSSTVLWNSGPVDIVCKLNTADFSVLNVTFRSSRQAFPTAILQIQRNGNVNDLDQEDDVTVHHVGQLVTISILNASCSTGDFYGIVAVNIHGKAEATSEGKLVVGISPSDDIVLKLHPDQIAGLGAYRLPHLHICEANIGYPRGEIQIEILNQGESEFEVLNVDIISSTENTDSPCSIKKKVSFGIVFTSNMDKAIIRCRVKSNMFPDDPLIYSNNGTISLIPNDFCEGTNATYNPHMTNCHFYIQCVGNVEYGKSCQSDLCFGIHQTVGCDYCYNAICQSEITTTSKPETTAPVPLIDISCMDVSVLQNSGAAVMTCSLNDTATFTMMNVTYMKKGDSDVQQIAMIGASNNIDIFAMQDSVIISIVNNIINITILNPSCENEGTFGIVTNINNETVEDKGTFTVQYLPEKPVLKLSADQVIDLGFYRDTNFHTCTGIIGNPTKELILEIVYANTTEYIEIPDSILKDLKRNKTTTQCQNYEQIEFGLLFSSEMQDSKIRCRPSGNVDNDTIAETSLTLIPRDICACGNAGSYRGHPGSCHVQILCLAAGTIMYPWGRACLENQCRNSLSGLCSSDCSDSACNQDVPADFCTTATIPTTTPVPPKPSVEVSCNGSSIAINTGPVEVVCFFNETIYEYINITFTMHNDTVSSPVANIQAGGDVIMIDRNSNRVIEIDLNVIKIKTQTAYCDFGGTYGVTVNTGGIPGFDQGSLEILTKPDKPSIDQHLHIVEGDTIKYTCTGNVGNPPGYIEFLVRKHGEENFTVSSIVSTSSAVTPNDNCNNGQTFYHENEITSDWNRTFIKCRAINQRTITDNDDIHSYISNEEDIISIPADYCSSIETRKYHPRGCNYSVWCVSATQIYTQLCAETTCFSADPLQPCVLCSIAPPPCNATSSN